MSKTGKKVRPQDKAEKVKGRRVPGVCMRVCDGVYVCLYRCMYVLVYWCIHVCLYVCMCNTEFPPNARIVAKSNYFSAPCCTMQHLPLFPCSAVS